MSLANDSGWRGLAANVVGSLALLFLINAPAPALGLRFDDEPSDVVLSPPGWLVVLAWLLLFPAMGAARWLVVRSNAAGAPETASLIVGLAALCAAYAYYTLGLGRLTGVSPVVFGLAGNVAVIAWALWAAGRAARASGVAAGLLAAVAAWTSFATISVVQMVVRLRR